MKTSIEGEELEAFLLPVSALDEGLPFSSYSRRKEKWYDRTLLFEADSLPAEAFRTPRYKQLSDLNLTDGEYVIVYDDGVSPKVFKPTLNANKDAFQTTKNAVDVTIDDDEIEASDVDGYRILLNNSILRYSRLIFCDNRYFRIRDFLFFINDDLRQQVLFCRSGLRNFGLITVIICFLTDI